MYENIYILYIHVHIYLGMFVAFSGSLRYDEL